MGWEVLGIIVVVVVVIGLLAMVGVNALGLIIEILVEVLAALFSSRD
jgi:hypothetical protein